MIVLKNQHLRVEIAEPGEHPNDGVRFDRAGFITEVVLNNERHFCANEPKNLAHPSTGGRGLCCEMMLDLSGEAKVGEKYPKFGVGLILKETDEPYVFFEKYKIDHFPVEFTCTETEAGFRTEPLPCMGYALRQWKKITVDGCRVLTEWKLENVGEKAVVLEEYCHNFLSIDGMAISPDYVLDIPGLEDQGNEPKLYRGSGHELNLIGNGCGFTFAKAEPTVFEYPAKVAAKTAPFGWKLTHKGAKAYVEGEESYVPVRVNVWGTDHLISPEFIQRIELTPGKTAQWSRVMTFTDELA